ncbi:MAG: hypothetical protein JGK17_06210 [Microcoleus sp. PH2017_10_PVI_O_A]|uniref:hypothetical protein n=1 Tax=unclassified Microcoleus TaxID=2642155 RepID=UPI001D896575|nr:MULTISPECIES: hypothetical protein [unclassified Microcoleus]TAE84473.1 MAG: hypothetical protein EAZ83_05815 [Oscillatoriales cyanobacterium]MCC3405180.1 hypothetical protein [Microcoleus sp. PH2017_10_PVI_O_A]MCC3459267.1 hypothetical protein [Microcoleus sp. PH2017_11_PCY_U_A]MCC3477418.1 hypothetical protein [Microcoleus sp. PH2017_12_PCY_D_A]MCC3558511.1 hypothetical protein [Microcoleus sp. PH2017_27_LUM_O_A]
MAIHMPDRIAQIAAKITPATSGQEAILYTPSTATVLGTNIKYQGYMATVRCMAYIDSIGETFAPNILPTDTESQKEQKNQFFRANSKKALMVYLRSPQNEDFEAGLIDLYNVKPVFLAGIDEYFSGVTIYGIKFGWRIVAKMIDRGFGLLQNNAGAGKQNDWLSITGYVEEKSSLLQDHNNIVYNFIQ